MVSGAAAGMAATFNAPLAVGAAGGGAAAVRVAAAQLPAGVGGGRGRGGRARPRCWGPARSSRSTAGACVARRCDLLVRRRRRAPAGCSPSRVTALVYLSEDAFARLPIHWMWWPAIGGCVIGVGGLIEPRALGVGYDVIDELLTGRATIALIVGILVVKSLIWVARRWARARPVACWRRCS